MASTGGSGGDPRRVLITVLEQCSKQPLNTYQSVSFSYHTMHGSSSAYINIVPHDPFSGRYRGLGGEWIQKHARHSGGWIFSIYSVIHNIYGGEHMVEEEHNG